MWIYLTQEDLDNINRGRNKEEKLTPKSIEDILSKPDIVALNKLFPSTDYMGFTPGSDWSTLRKLFPCTKKVADRAAAFAEEEAKKALIAVEVNPKDPTDPLNIRESLEFFNVQRKRLPLVDQRAGANLERKIGYYLNRVPYQPQEALIYLQRSLEGHEAIASKSQNKANQPGEALVFYKNLLGEYKAVLSEPQLKLKPDLDLIRSLCILGNVWVDYGDNAKGIEFYERASNVLGDLVAHIPKDQKDENGDPFDPEIRYCQVMLQRHWGSAHNGRHERKEALEHYDAARKLIEKYYHRGDLHYIQAVISLAHRGKVEQAMALFEALVEEFPALVPLYPENFLTHGLYNNKARRILNENEIWTPESEEKLKGALQHCEKAKDILFQDSNNLETPFGFFITDTLSQIYLKLARHAENSSKEGEYVAEAIKWSEMSLNITKAVYGTKTTGHADLAKAWRRRGEIHDFLEKKDEAEFCYKTALPIAIQNLNPEHGDRQAIEDWLQSHGIDLQEEVAGVHKPENQEKTRFVM